MLSCYYILQGCLHFESHHLCQGHLHYCLLSIVLTNWPQVQAHLDPVTEDPVHVCGEEAEEQVEMNLVSEASHLSEVEEDEDGQEEGDDGHCVPQEEYEDPPLFYCPHLYLMVQTVSVVCIVIPHSIFQADFADVV